MRRSEWIAIAEALRSLRDDVASKQPLECSAIAAHDRKLIYFAQLAAIDRVASEIADVLNQHACSFERQRFLRIVGLATPIVPRARDPGD